MLFKHAFKMMDTYGLPLSTITIECEKRGMRVDWDEFLKDARHANWSWDLIAKKIAEAKFEHEDLCTPLQKK